MRHIDDGQLHAYLDGALHAAEPGRVEEMELHLAGCAVCQMRLEREGSLRHQAHAILGMAAPLRIDPPPFEQVRQRLGVPPPRRATPPRVVSLAGAASVVLALGLGWLERASMRPPEASPERLAEGNPSPAPAPKRAPSPAPTSPEATPRVPGPVAARPVRRLAAAPSAPVGATAVAPSEHGAEAAEPPRPTRSLADATGPSGGYVARPGAPDSTVVRGQVTDESGRPLAGVQVHVPALAARTVTGRDGAYAISLPGEQLSGEDTVSISAMMVGMEAEQRSLAIRPGQERAQNFRLRAAAVGLEALVVSATAKTSPRWIRVERSAAEQALGQRIRTVPDLPVIGIELGKRGDTAVVRVRQRIGRRATLVLEQAPHSEIAELRSTAGDTGSAAQEVSATQRRGEAEIVLRVGGARVSARAPTSLDGLRALLKRLQ